MNMKEPDRKETLRKIEEVVAQMVAEHSIEAGSKDTAKLLLAALCFGTTNADKLATLTGLNRDKFVRPRAKRLREGRIWRPEGIVTEYSDDAPEEQNIEFLLHILVAEGLVDVTFDDSPSVNEEPKLEKEEPPQASPEYDDVLRREP
jgi:hypothetical protein